MIKPLSFMAGYNFSIDGMDTIINKFFGNQMECKMDWEMLKANWGSGKFAYSLWEEDICKITKSEGGLSIIQAWLDNQRTAANNDCLKMLLNSGVDINHKDRDGANMLWTAAMRRVDMDG